MITSRPVLLVEDNQDDVFLIRRAISHAGVMNPLYVVENGQDAIHYLSGKDKFRDRSKYPLPAVIFLDLKLPLKSGHEVLAWIRQQQSLESTAVVVLTSSEDPADIKKSYQLGANSFLIKPPSPGELIEICGGYLFGTAEVRGGNVSKSSQKRA